MPITERFRDEVRRRAMPATPSPEAAALARWIADRAEGSVAGIVFFGSRKHRAGPQATSAHDLFVATRGYLEFYRAMRRAGLVRRGARVMATLNAVLAPNQVSLRWNGPQGQVHAKCAVVSLGHFRRETSRRRHDHFVIGRLFQPSEVLWAADQATADALVDGLVSAHALTAEWVRPWLPPVFDVAGYCRALLRVSFGAEIRPEPSASAEALWEAQQDYLRPVYGLLLEDLAEAGDLLREGAGTYALARRPGLAERLAWSAYFRWSLLRATARWAKHVVTFEGWLDFLLGKARRHSGQEIVLTERERRMPLVFLWPRLVRYLRHKDKQEPF